MCTLACSKILGTRVLFEILFEHRERMSLFVIVTFFVHSTLKCRVTNARTAFPFRVFRESSRSSSREEAIRVSFSGETWCTRKSVSLSNNISYFTLFAFIPPPRRHSAARTRSFEERSHFNHYGLRGHLTKWTKGGKCENARLSSRSRRFSHSLALR